MKILLKFMTNQVILTVYLKLKKGMYYVKNVFLVLDY